jgi:hypothetical protein
LGERALCRFQKVDRKGDSRPQDELMRQKAGALHERSVETPQRERCDAREYVGSYLLEEVLFDIGANAPKRARRESAARAAESAGSQVTRHPRARRRSQMSGSLR